LSQVERQVSHSKEILESHVGTCSLFSYPNGNFSAGVREIVAKQGYRFAFMTYPGIWHKTADHFAIPRINISEDSITGFRGRFSPTAFEYWAFWRAFVAGRKTVKEQAPELVAYAEHRTC